MCNSTMNIHKPAQTDDELLGSVHYLWPEGGGEPERGAKMGQATFF